MKKFIYLAILILITNSIFAQKDVRGNRIIADQSIFFPGNGGRWIDTVKNDSINIENSGRTLMSAKAIYEFVKGRYDKTIINQKDNIQDGNTWLSGYSIYGKKREVTGIINSDNFTGPGFGNVYDSSVSNVVLTFNGQYLKDSVKGAGEGSLNNFIAINAPTGRQQWVQIVKWLATRKNTQDYGIGIGLRSTNSFFSPDFFVHFVWRNNLGQNGSVQLYLDNQPPGSPAFVTHDTVGTTIGDTMISRVEYIDGLITIKYTNQTTGETVDTSYNFGTSTAGTYQAPNTGKFLLRFFGGVHKIFSWEVTSNEKIGSVLFDGNSITYGYTGSEYDSTYPARIFSERWQYEKSGGPGDRSTDNLSKIKELISLNPSWLIHFIGVNDRQSGVSGSTFSTNERRFMDSMVVHNIPVIIMSLTPLNSISVVPFNDTLQSIASDYGFKYVNIFDSLNNGGTNWNSSYTTDNIHPNDEGHKIIARILAREAPEILGYSHIYTNRPIYKKDAKYHFVYDEDDGSVKVSKIPEQQESNANNNSNIGSGYRILLPGTQEIKTLNIGYGIILDSTTNSNGITITLDSTVVFPAVRATVPEGEGGGSGVSQATITDTLQNYWRKTGNHISSADWNIGEFIGTLGNNSLKFKSNGYLRARLDSAGTAGTFRLYFGVSTDRYIDYGNIANTIELKSTSILLTTTSAFSSVNNGVTTLVSYNGEVATGNAATVTGARRFAIYGQDATHSAMQLMGTTIKASAIAGGLDYNGDDLLFANSTTVRGKIIAVRLNSSSAGTLSLATTYTHYVFTGTTSTWTLPPVSGTTGHVFYIKNRGSGTITLNSDTGNTLYTTTATNTVAINAGESLMLLSDGTYYLQY